MDVLLEKLLVEKVGDAEAAARHFVFIGGADAARSGSDLDPSGSILGAEFDHAMVGQDDMGAIADEEIGRRTTVRGTCHLEPGGAQGGDLLHESERIEDDAVTDDRLRLLAEDAAGNELQDELLAGDGDGMSGVVSAGIARDNFKVIGEHIDDFALALIAPLGAENHRGLCFAHSYLPNTDAAGLRRDLHTGAGNVSPRRRNGRNS